VIVLQDVDGDGTQDIVGSVDFNDLEYRGTANAAAIRHTGDNTTGQGRCT
jgi:hypothetical protein